VSAFLDLVDAVFPRACRLCGGVAEDGLACEEHALPERPDGARCGRCASLLPVGLPDGFPCASCRRSPPRYARVVALADYRDDAGARQWILALKHGRRRDLAEPLGALLAQRLAEVPGAEGAWLVPVPLHPLRRWERGYDQAALLAAAVARRSGLPLRRAVVRVRHTAVQGAPGAPSRRANLRGAFAVDPDRAAGIAGREVWLVDDVTTSGATAEEGAAVLRRAGARSVSVLCLARAAGVDGVGGRGGNS